MRKDKLDYIRQVLYFIIGYIVFNIVFGITQVVILNILGSNGNILEIFIENLYINIIIYTIIYIVIILLNFTYKKTITKKLNEKLQKLKERSENNEE